MECVIFYANSIFMNIVICHCRANSSMQLVLQPANVQYAGCLCVLIITSVLLHRNQVNCPMHDTSRVKMI